MFRVLNPTVSGGGTITTAYGLYVDALSGGGTNYAIYTNAGLVRFGDAVDIIGSDAADTQLLVKGAAAQSANLQEWQNSAGTILAVVDEEGHVGVLDTPTEYIPFTVLKSENRGDANTLYGALIRRWLSTTGTQTGVVYGLFGSMHHAGTGTVNTTKGIFAGVYGASSGTTADASGLHAYAEASGSANFTSAIGVRAQISNVGSGAIGVGYALFVSSPVNSGGGTFTTHYGLYISAQTAAGTNYAIYTNAGDVRLGDDTLILGHAAVGANSSIVAAQTFRVVETYTDAATAIRGMVSTLTSTQTAANTAQVFTGASLASNSSNHAFDYTSTFALRGLSATATHAGTGTVAGQQGATFQAGVTAAGTVTANYGAYILAGFVSGGGVITNNYGLYIANQTVGTANYGMFIAGGSTAAARIQTGAATAIGVIIRGAAAQSASLLQLQESDATVFLDSGDGLGGSVFVINQQGEAIDFRIETDNEDQFFLIDGSDDLLRIGDFDTNYMEVDNTGDVVFVGGAGLCFAEISAYDAADTLTIAASGIANKVQVTSFDTNGVSNNMTPDHTNDHITVDVAGMYLCTVSLAALSAAGTGFELGVAVYKNNGATLFQNCHAHHDLAGGGGDTGSTPLSGILDLAASDTIEVWVWNENNTTDVVIEDITLSLVQIGGT
jgi:hypothetical protein